MLVREVTIDDAEEVVHLIQTVESETDFMLFEAGERKLTSEQLRSRIENLIEAQNSTFLVAEDDGRLVGYLMATGGAAKRNRHSVYLVVGILQKATGKGVGTKMFEKLLQWAKDQNIHRLELTVMSHNERAVALYKKMGFEIEGVKKDSLYVNGQYVDEYYMARLLS